MTRRAELLEALTAMPGDLGRWVRGRDAAAFSSRLTVEGWSGLDVLYHLLWVEERSLIRIQMVVTQDKPVLFAIPPHETLPPVEPAALFDQFCQQRQQTLNYLQSLTPGQWQRTGQHPTRGPLSVRYLADYLVVHDTEHLNQLLQLIGA